MDATLRRLHSILHNALAYKHSALVYLYRTVHELERAHVDVQRHARAALHHCAGTVSAGGPMGALLWPLFVAACEAVADEDRALARQTFAGVEKGQGMMNIERAWEIVQEVWRRADEVDAGHDHDHDNHPEMAATPPPLGVAFATFPFEDMFGAAQPSGPVSPERPPSRGALPQKRGRGADLWRRVSRDMGVNIVFG